MGPFGSSVGQVTLELPSSGSSGCMWPCLPSSLRWWSGRSGSGRSQQKPAACVLGFSSLPIDAVAGPSRFSLYLPFLAESSPHLACLGSLSLADGVSSPTSHLTRHSHRGLSRLSQSPQHRVRSCWHFGCSEPCQCGKCSQPPPSLDCESHAGKSCLCRAARSVTGACVEPGTCPGPTPFSLNDWVGARRCRAWQSPTHAHRRGGCRGLV